jgi:hypothetical protein
MRVFLKESNAWFLLERSSTDLRGWIKSKKRGESVRVRDGKKKRKKEKGKKETCRLSFFLSFFLSFSKRWLVERFFLQ